jgi:hypothetical protein
LSSTGFRRLLLIALAALFVSTSALGDKVSTRAAADALFKEAVALAEAGKFAQAVVKFHASYELDPARGTLQGLALAEEKAGHVLAAYTHFQKLADEAERAKDGSRAEMARAELALVEPRVPKVTLTFASDVPSGTKVTLDGDDIPDGAIGSALPVTVGDHHVVATAPDGRKFARMLGLSEGARARLEITWLRPSNPVVEQALPPERPPADSAVVAPAARDEGPAHPELRTAGLALGGAGLLLAGIGTYLWIDSGKDHDAVTANCTDGVCPPDQQDRIDSGQRKENWSRITLIGGGLFLAGGVTLFVMGNRRPDAARAEARLGPGGVVVAGHF